MNEELLKKNAVLSLQKAGVDLYKETWVKIGKKEEWKVIGKMAVRAVLFGIVIGILSIEVDTLHPMVYVYPLLILLPFIGLCICLPRSAEKIGKYPDENFSRKLIYIVKNDVKNHCITYKYAENGEIKEDRYCSYRLAGTINANEYATMVSVADINQRLICEDTSWKA